MFVLFLNEQNYSDNQGEKKKLFLCQEKMYSLTRHSLFLYILFWLGFHTIAPGSSSPVCWDFVRSLTSVPSACDSDLCPGCSPRGAGMYVQSDFRWCLVSWPINQPASLALTLKGKGTFSRFPKVNRA